MPSPEELKRLFKEAAEIAEQVPEDLRQVAFQRALDALFDASVPPEQRRAAAEKPRSDDTHQTSRAGIRSGAVTRLLETMNRSEMAHLMAGKKTLDRALLLLQAAQAHDIHELSAADIAQLLSKKFREATTPAAVRMALDRSPSYTDRRPSGGTFLYSIMAPGERYLEGDAPSASPRAAKRTRSTKAPKASAPNAEALVAKPAKVRKLGKTWRPGPKAALEILVAEGFFAQPRTMGEILTYLEEKKAHRYRTSDFTATLQRMMRQSKLERTRNSDGQYEYKER